MAIGRRDQPAGRSFGKASPGYGGAGATSAEAVPVLPLPAVPTVLLRTRCSVLPSVLAVREPPSADCRDAASAAAQRCLLTVRRRLNPRRPRWPRSCPVRPRPFRYYVRCRLSDSVCTTPSSFLQLGRAWLRFPGRPVVSPTRRSTDPPPFRWIHPFLMPRLGVPHHPVKTDTPRRRRRSPQDHPPTWSTPDPSGTRPATGSQVTPDAPDQLDHTNRCGRADCSV